MPIVKRRKTITAVKRAISLPSDVDAEVAILSQAEGKSYSSMVYQALKFFLKRREDLEMEMAYRAYYNDPRQRAESEALAAELFVASGSGLEEPEETRDAPDKRRGGLD